MSDFETAPYLYNPETGRVMVNTEQKRRLCPNLLPCDSPEGPSGKGIKVHAEPKEDPRIEETFKEAEVQKAAGPEELLTEIDGIEDKSELAEIGEQMGCKLDKRMSVATMRGRLKNHIAELTEG
jgi:hypothetical protein